MARPFKGKYTNISKKPTIVRHTVTVEVSVKGLAKKLYNAREASGKTIREVMGAIGMSDATWGELIRGKTNGVRLDVLMRLEKVLDCDLGLDWTQWTPPPLMPNPNLPSIDVE